MLASFARIAARREQAILAPKRPRRLGTSASRRLQRIRREQRRVELPTAGGRLEVSIQGRLAAVDAVAAALELVAMAEDVEAGADPRSTLAELLDQRTGR